MVEDNFVKHISLPDKGLLRPAVLDTERFVASIRPGETTVGQLLESLKYLLEEAGFERPQIEAELLVSEVIQTDRLGVIRHIQDPLQAIHLRLLRCAAAKLARGMPVPLIVGYTEILGVRIQVTPSVLVPGPETEILASLTIELLEQEKLLTSTLVDVGTGSGVLALCAAVRFPSLRVYATELAEQALAVARENAERLGLKNVTFLQGDLLDPLEAIGLMGRVDVIVSNPPYVRTADIPALLVQVRDFAPRLAIDGGPDGLRMHHRVIADSGYYLRPGGFLLLETETGQCKDVLRLLADDRRYDIVGTYANHRGVDRIAVARLREEASV